ncbi:MAG TPA: YbaK/EbsC family protein [Pirellulales bacterium]|nr:YbaK/EbsC family protein [Pirellulales bacterium]
MSSEGVLESIRAFLKYSGVDFVEKHHPPTFTSEESAHARGEPLAIGAKALVIKTDDRYRLFVLPADRKIDSQAIKRHLGAKKLRFATADELHHLTSLPPGSVPPFGPPILPLELFADEALGRNDRIAFNAGSLTTSIVMPFADYRRVSGACWLEFSQPNQAAI